MQPIRVSFSHRVIADNACYCCDWLLLLLLLVLCYPAENT